MCKSQEKEEDDTDFYIYFFHQHHTHGQQVKSNPYSRINQNNNNFYVFCIKGISTVSKQFSRDK